MVLAMNNLNFFFDTCSKPVCTGTGLIALDVIMNGQNRFKPYFMTGGSCGNVMTILSYLGWQSYPVGRLKEGTFSNFIINDLKKWGVDTSFLNFDEKATTPVIIEKIKQIENEGSTHTFCFYCPECNSFLPRYRSITINQVDSFSNDLPHSDICYIDRVSSGAFRFAKKCKENGSIIFFEPTKITDEKEFIAFLDIADILKYSHEIAIADRHTIKESNIPLIVETKGSYGLEYILKNGNTGQKKWQQMKSYKISNIIDTAGAGDWCSAGLIHILHHQGIQDITQLERKTLKMALTFGQALAGFNCKFYGARGSMYSISKEKFHRSIHDLIKNGDTPIISNMISMKRPKKSSGACPICNELLR